MTIDVKGRGLRESAEITKMALPYIAGAAISRGLGRAGISKILKRFPSLGRGLGKVSKQKAKGNIIRPYSANVRAIQPTKEGSYVLFSNGSIYKYLPSMTPALLSTLAKPFRAATTGKNKFKPWVKGTPSIGGSFWRLIAAPSQREAETYKKVAAGPQKIMRAKMEDAAK